MHSFKLGNLKARDQLVKLGVDERIILKWILKNECGRALDSTNLAQDRGKWAAVDTAMNLRVPKMS